MKNLFFLCIAVLFAGASMAQEEVVPLKYNASLQDQFKHKLQSQELSSSRESAEYGAFIYLIDTIQLPFIDDFSTNKMKRYNAKQGDANVTAKVRNAFTVNLSAPSIFEAVFYQTYTYTKFLNGTLDSVANPELHIVYFDTTGEAIGFDTVYTNYISTNDQTTGLVTYDTLLADTVLYNEFDTLYLVEDDASIWMTKAETIGDRGPYINNRYPIAALTQGVATLDGTDAAGFPYDAVQENTYGLADELESKPIYLDSTMNNIYFSFYYEAGGIGNEPDIDDSLTLDFFDVKNQNWVHVWSTEGLSEFDTTFSDQVVIHVEQGIFRRPGFKFRFRNYATLSGSYDHWHIDYVRLDKNVDTNLLDTINDISYLHAPISYLAEYTNVPYRHYLADPTLFQASTNKFTIRNLNSIPIFTGDIECVLRDETLTDLLTFTTNETGFPELATVTYNLQLPNTQIFPAMGTDIAKFETECYYQVTGNNIIRSNDTIRHTQVFADYYAYDDATAENAYALAGAGLSLAYRFDTPIKDTLKALYINFPQMAHDQNDELAFKFKIWKDLYADPIYVDGGWRTPTYTKGNEFRRYELDEEIEIDGEFYIGFTQQEAEKIYVGFDKNTDSSEKLAYYVDGEWLQSKFAGSLLFRPDFGYEDLLEVNEIESTSKEIQVYPNPTNNGFNLIGLSETAQIQIFNLNGQLIQSQMVQPNETVSTQNLSSGLYFIKVQEQFSEKMYTSRVVITQ